MFHTFLRTFLFSIPTLCISTFSFYSGSVFGGLFEGGGVLSLGVFRRGGCSLREEKGMQVKKNRLTDSFGALAQLY